MPIPGWSKFLKAFMSLQEQQLTFNGDAQAALLELQKLVTAVSSSATMNMSPSQTELNSLRTRLNQASTDFNATTASATLKKDAIARTEAVRDEARAFIRDIKLALEANVSTLPSLTGGEEILDQLVEASSDTTFLTAALKARYGVDTLTLNGDPRAKTLKKLYEVTKLVPTSHTRDNPRLREICFKRQAETEDEERFWGLYTPSKDQILLRIPLSDERKKDNPKDHDPEVSDGHSPTGPVEAVLGTMAHEVGHAVDAAQHVMSVNGETKAYGGWKRSSATDMAKAIAEHRDLGACTLGQDLITEMLEELINTGASTLDTNSGDRKQDALLFPTVDVIRGKPYIVETIRTVTEWRQQDSWPTGDALRDETNRLNGLVTRADEDEIEWAITKKYYDLILRNLIKRKMDADEAIRAARAYHTRHLEDISDPQRQALVTSEAGQLARWVYEKGVSIREGLYKQKKSGADKLTLGALVYTRGNDARFYTYDPDARSVGVSAYQFNAPGEWFAELYMFFYCGKLSDKHPSVTGVISRLAS
ncbi:MAG: hypothetical protein H6741_21395 [Alphaproteobacteria bacterium]|nr:hypothetical protein [Alphaproteobacteria bacterium]